MKRSIQPASSTGSPLGLVPFQRTRNEIAKARQEVDAHAWMKTVGIVATDREETDARVVPEGYQRRRTNFVGILTEQEVALAVANLATAR